MTRLEYALGMLAGGVSLIPISLDGAKRPAIKWKGYQERLPQAWEVRTWVRKHGWGIAAVGGVVSGNLEVLDFDATDYFEYWSNLVESYHPQLIETLPLVKTPTQGFHLYYRCPSIDGNQKLAQGSSFSIPDQRWRPEKTLIETRGEGGYAVTPASPGTCHPSGERYRVLHGSLWQIPCISPEERASMLKSARAFNEYLEPQKPVFRPVELHGERPGDVFAATHSWENILEPYGWQTTGRHGEIQYWSRPGKKGQGQSATTGYEGLDMFYVFSSNAYPFDARKGYSKFHTYVILEHRGDFSSAARALSERSRHAHA